MNFPLSRRAGFTLIELSVVLVIIGLLVGGVVAGQGLIRNSQLLSVGKRCRALPAGIVCFPEPVC